MPCHTSRQPGFSEWPVATRDLLSLAHDHDGQQTPISNPLPHTALLDFQNQEHPFALRSAAMVFLHLFIVNKSGGLIHHRPLSNKAPTIGTNEWLRIGSTFHSLHAIAAEASPVRLSPNGKNAGECVQVKTQNV